MLPGERDAEDSTRVTWGSPSGDGRALPELQAHYLHAPEAIFAEGEVDERAVVKYFLTTDLDGKNYRVGHCHLDTVLAERRVPTSVTSVVSARTAAA